jgi:hypothetical protein
MAIMNLNKTAMLIAQGACLLGLSTLGSDKNPVTRPNKVRGHITIVVDLRDGSFVANGVEQQTHMGRTTHTITGQMDLSPGKIVSGTGVLTAANGDEIFVGVDPDTGDAIVTGGSGRFEGVTITWTMMEVWNDEVTVEWPFLTRCYDWMGEGTITY